MLLSEWSSSLIPSTNCLPACSSVPSNLSLTKLPELTILSLFWDVWWISCTCTWGDIQAHSPAHQDPLWHGPHRLNPHSSGVVPWTFVLQQQAASGSPVPSICPLHLDQFLVKKIKIKKSSCTPHPYHYNPQLTVPLFLFNGLIYLWVSLKIFREKGTW